MYYHDRADMRMKSFRAGDVAVIGSPKDFQPGVDSLDCGAAFVKLLKFFCGARDRWKSSQVDLAFDAYGQAVFLARVTAIRTRATPPVPLVNLVLFAIM